MTDEAKREPHGHPATVLTWWELWPMLAWGLYSVHLYTSGRIHYLLQPLYAKLAFGGGVVLLAGFAVGWVHRWRTLRRHGPVGTAEAGAVCPACAAEPPGWGRIARSLAFIVPLVVGFSLPSRGMNSLAAVQWGATDPSMVAELAAQREAQQAEERSGYPWVNLIGAAQRLGGDAPVRAGTLGFIVRPKAKGDAAAPPALLVRFTMRCCAACAQPVAVPLVAEDAEAEAVLAGLEENTWVEAYGRIDPAREAFVAELILPVPEPDQPYL